MRYTSSVKRLASSVERRTSCLGNLSPIIIGINRYIYRHVLANI
jgi:hypothetical protein